MKTMYRILLIGTLLLFPGCRDQSYSNTQVFRDDRQETLPVDPDLKTGSLENGLTYYIRYNPKPAKRMELRLVLLAGSALENDNQSGVAHFIEHMSFHGTKNYTETEIIDYVEAAGMRFGQNMNAYTDFDESLYKLQIPSNNNQTIEKGIRIFADWAGNIIFDESAIAKEKKIIMNEYKMDRDIAGRLWDKHLPVVCRNSRYANRPPIGYADAIQVIRQDTLHRFYKNWYRPDLMAVIAVGDADITAVEKAIKTAFSGLPLPDAPQERPEFPVPEHTETLFSIQTSKETAGSRVKIIIKHKAEPVKTRKDYYRLILQQLFLSGLNGRLEAAARRSHPQLMTGYAAITRLIRNMDALIISAELKENEIGSGFEDLLMEAERIKKMGFTRAEMERAKKSLAKFMDDAYNGKNNTDSSEYADQYTDHFTKQYPVPGIEYEYRLFKKYLSGIELKEVNTLAAGLLKDENRVITLDLPEKAGCAAPRDSDLMAVIRHTKEMAFAEYQDFIMDKPLMTSVPVKGSIKSEKKYSKPGLTEWKLSNGATIVLKPAVFDGDRIFLDAFSPGGLSLVSDEDYVSAAIALSVISQSGIGGFNGQELQQKFSGKNPEVVPWMDEAFEGIRGSANNASLESMLQWIYLLFTQPRCDEDAFINFKNRFLEHVKNGENTPETIFWDTVQCTITGNHFRTRPWSGDMTAEMNREKALAFFKDRYKDAGDFTFIITGNFSLKKIKPLVLSYLGGLPALFRKELRCDRGIDPPAGVEERIIKKGAAGTGKVQITFNGLFHWSYNNLIMLDAMTELANIRFREQLREEQGSIYALSVTNKAAHFPDEEYYISINFNCRPDELEEANRNLFSIIKKWQDGFIQENYAGKIRERLKQDYEIRLNSNTGWLEILKLYYSNALDPNLIPLITDYKNKIDKITITSLKNAAREYFNLDRYIKVIMIPDM